MAGVGWLLGTVLDFLASLLRYPVPLAALALVIAPLWNFGRTVGLPVLFWHEQPRARRMAGVAVTLHAAAVTFVVFLLELGRRPQGAPDLARFFAGAAIVVAALLLPAAILRWRRSLRYAAELQRGGGDERPGLVAPVRDPDRGGAGALRSVHFSPWPLLQGALLAAAGVALAVTMAVWLRRESIRPPGWVLTALLLGADTREPWLHLLALAMVAWIGIASWLFRSTATPAVAICLLLSGLTAVDGFLAFRLGHPAPGVLLGLTALVVAGSNRYKLRLPALAAWYARPLAYPPPAPEADRRPGGLLDLLSRDGVTPGASAARRPLILLCASGGGIRAAAWAAGILDALDQLPGFRPALRLVTGASGGMVGATFWIGKLHAGRAPREAASAVAGDLVARVAGDSLTPVARALAFTDAPLAFTPFTNRADRGEALERAWRAQAPEWLDVTFGSLREHEARGELPSLVYAPMLVEDGRRLILSNLDLAPVTRNEVRWVDAAGRAEGASSSAVHLDTLFPGALADLPLRTAARLSAAFPYLSPAIVLPTMPRRRVVDAGYYDNYGVNLACGWLRECLRDERRRGWFAAHVSRVLVVQVRDNVSELSMNRERPARRPAKGGPLATLGRWAGRGFQGITSPVHALLTARTSAMLFQNDADLETVTELYDRAFGDGFLTTTVFDLKADVSLSWYLTDAELALVRAQLESAGIRQKIRDVAAWLAR